MATALSVCALCVLGCYDTVSVNLFPDAGFDAGTDAGADVPDADVPDANVPIMGCMDLCDTVLDWSSARLSCIAQVLRLAGYAPGATPACRLIRGPQECMECADGMGLPDNVCIGVAYICLP